MKRKLSMVFIFVIIGLLVSCAGCTKTETFIQKTWNRTSYGITKIALNDISADINIISSFDGQIHIMYFESESTTYDISIDINGVLSFMRKNPQKTSNVTAQSQDKICTTIAIPADFAGDIDVTSVSSNFVMDTATIAGSLSAETISGKITVNNCKIGGNATLTSTSGSISVLKTELSVGEMNINTVSGDIFAEECLVNNNIIADTISSNILFNKVCGNNFRCTSTSGSLSLLIMNNEMGYTINAKTTTGTVNAPSGGNGSYEIFAKTTSGNITIAIAP